MDTNENKLINNYISIIRKSYEKMSDGNNVEGSLNLLTAIGHLSLFQRELTSLSHTNNYFNAEIIYNVIADVSISYMYIQDVCEIDNNELTFAIKYTENIDSVQMLVILLTELQIAILLFLQGETNKPNLTNALARAIVATELAQKMYNITDDTLAKIINTKLNYLQMR